MQRGGVQVVPSSVRSECLACVWTLARPPVATAAIDDQSKSQEVQRSSATNETHTKQVFFSHLVLSCSSLILVLSAAALPRGLATRQAQVQLPWPPRPEIPCC